MSIQTSECFKKYMKIIYLALLIVWVFTSCRHERDKASNLQKHILKRNVRSHSSDTLIIDRKAAVDIQLDSAALEQNKKKYGDTTIEAYAEDGSYYESIADSVIEKKRLQLIQSLHHKFIKFVQDNGAITMVKVDTLPAVSTLFFFDPTKPPHIVDVTDTENEYKNYFR